MISQRNVRTPLTGRTAPARGVGSRSRVVLLAVVGMALVVPGLSGLGLSGCRNKSNGTATSRAGDGKQPTIDARGGATDSDQFLGVRTPTDGNGGNGGTIRIASMVGDMSFFRRGRTFLFPAQTLAGVGGLTVRRGERMAISGTRILTFVFVQEGGQLILEGNTLLQVSGDVRITGGVKNVAGETGRLADGPDFTILAGGSIHISGKIDLSGADMEEAQGGHGGNAFIVAGDGTETADERLLMIDGVIDTKGGSSESDNPINSTAGFGGDIVLGSFGRIEFAGRLNARAGKSFTNDVVTGPSGGDISVIAVGDVLFEGMREINASGGDSSGIPGTGGSIQLTAENGSISLESFDIDNFGGNASFQNAVVSGNGGAISINGTTVSITDSVLRSRGGDALEDVDAIGGDAGTVSVTATTAVAMTDTSIMLRGGNTIMSGEEGGAGGAFVVSPFGVGGTFTFDGTVNIRGGRSFSDREGDHGDYCATGADTQSTARVIGKNFFPLGACSEDAVTGVADLLNELDNQPATIRPASRVFDLETIRIRVFRVFPLAGADAVFTVTGDAGGDVDIFIINGDRLAQVQSSAIGIFDLTNPAIFAFSAENRPTADEANSETLTVADADLGGVIGADGFFLLAVITNSAFPETVSVVLDE